MIIKHQDNGVRYVMDNGLSLSCVWVGTCEGSESRDMDDLASDTVEIAVSTDRDFIDEETGYIKAQKNCWVLPNIGHGSGVWCKMPVANIPAMIQAVKALTDEDIGPPIFQSTGKVSAWGQEVLTRGYLTDDPHFDALLEERWFNKAKWEKSHTV